mgnify:FL=1
MTLEAIDSRRLTGPNLLWDAPGAVLDVASASSDDAGRRRLAGAGAAWQGEARRLLDAVGWQSERTCVLEHPNGCSLAISAPLDALYAATELNEAAWRFAVAAVGAPSDGAEAEGGDGDGEAAETFEETVTRLRDAIDAERDPRLQALQRAATERRVRILIDDEALSLGAGRGSRTWLRDGPYSENEGAGEGTIPQLPSPDEVPWEELHDVPVALITGTNGKTTTTRLLAAMVRQQGLGAGQSSTEGVWVDGEAIGEGDFSGPDGARLVLRHPGVDVALLETARGGLLRRGLAVTAADVALITNVAEDHLGEFGIHDLEGLARVKAIVARATRHLVLNHDDEVLRELGRRLQAERPELVVHWFTLERDPRQLAEIQLAADGAIERLGSVAGLIDGRLVRVDPVSQAGAAAEGELVDFGAAADLPLTLGGAARYNVANALGALLVAHRLGLVDEAAREALARFGGAAQNPGRGNVFTYGRARVIADFAHNPHGIEAVLDTARRLDPERLLVVIGQAGDRDDRALTELAHTVARHDPDLVILKRMGEYSRGREAGEVAEHLARALAERGVGGERQRTVEDESAALELLRAELRAGDVALFTVHAQRQPTLDALAALERAGFSV